MRDGNYKLFIVLVLDWNFLTIDNLLTDRTGEPDWNRVQEKIKNYDYG